MRKCLRNTDGSVPEPSRVLAKVICDGFPYWNDVDCGSCHALESAGRCGTEVPAYGALVDMLLLSR